jgi:hypothetical protein
MPAYLLNASILFGIARGAYQDSKALVAIVLSVVALEAFINEMAEMASAAMPKAETEPQKIAAFAEILKYVEESRGSLEMKYNLAKWVCTGQFYEKDAKPYQDFADLIATRNALIHYKVLDKITFAEDGSASMAEPKILKRLESKGILADVPAGLNVAWIEKVGTSATARWACETAAAMVQSTIASLPEGLFKRVAEAGFGKSFQIPSP